MAEDITFVHFRYGTYAEINNSANNRTLNPHAVYIATDKQLMYAKGAWIGVTSVTSEVNQDTGEITLKFNYDSEGQPTGNPITCPIKGAGMTTEQKAQLETAYKFAIDIGGTSADDIINKWQEVVDFLAGIEGGTLEGIVATKADKNTTITAGDGLTGGGDLSENRTINVVSADDGITVNSDSIQLNTVDNLTTSSKTKPLSANQGKVLDGKITDEATARQTADTKHTADIKSIADLLNDMFEKVTDNGKTYIKTKYGFASDKFVSAGGTDDTESGGSGGVNLTQMWESLQGNSDTFANIKINKAHIPTLDTSHIPTLTTGKISDFVSATQAIADTAVANKADKATTLEGYGITDAFKWYGAINSSNDDSLWGKLGAQSYGDVLPDGLIGQYPYGILTSYNNNRGTDSQFQLYASDYRGDNSIKRRHIAWRTGFGANKGTWQRLANIDTENIFTESPTFQKQIKSTIATGTAPLSVVSTTLVTNLNADRLDGLHASDFAKNLLNATINIDENIEGLYGGKLNGANGTFPDDVNYVNNGAYLAFGQRGYEVNIASRYNITYLRTKEAGTISNWREVAFMDIVLPITGGTLTGALTVNAPINNTGALKLLGASEVSSTGMAVGAGAKALGTQSRALASNSYAGLRTGDSTYPYASIKPYDLQPFTVNGNTVYGIPIPIGETVKYTYNNVEYSAENTTSTTQVLVLISVGSDFVAGVTYPLNKCVLTYSKGYSLGRGQKIHAISELSDTVRAITIYTWVTGSTDETNFINNFVISNSNKFYTYKGVSLSTQSGDYSVASGSYSVASGSYSVASGSSSVASGSYSVASGSSSVASGDYSVASGSSSVASGSSSVASGSSSVASGAYSVASGSSSVASHESSKVFATRGISGRKHQTVLGLYNAEDTTSALVVGWGSSDTNRKNVFTVDTNGHVRMGNRLHIGVGGKNELYLQSDVADQLYVHTSAGIPFLIQGNLVRRGYSAPTTTLGTDQYKWYNVFTEALKIADANLTYDTGTLTIDKALTVASTLTAPQGVFSNSIKIGNATISWNPKGYLVIDEGLASHKFISAGGVVTGDAGGGGGGLSLTDMWVSLNGNIDAYGKSKIHIDHIPLDAILSHDSYENDVANRINTFNYSNSSSFTSAVKALIVADNIPTLEMSKIDGLETTLTNIGTVVQNNYDNLNESISTLQNGTIADHEARIKALERALTWQTV